MVQAGRLAILFAVALQLQLHGLVRNLKLASTRRQPWQRRARGDGSMLETIAIILIVLWLLGMVSGYTMGNFIYVLLVIAIVLFLVRLVSGRRVV
jgi:uncharacterized membrane protein YjdF